MFLFPYFLNIMGWSLLPILEKTIIRKIGILNFGATRWFYNTVILIIFYLCYTLFTNNPWHNNYKLKDFLDNSKLALLISLIGIVALIANFYLLKHYPVHYVIAMVEAALVLLAAFWSIIILKEKISTYKCIGIFLISLGIFLINIKAS